MVTELLKDRVRLISSFDLFSGIDKASLLDVAGLSRPVKLKKNDILFREGGSTHGLYLLLSGKIKLTRSSPKGKEQTLLIIFPEQSFAMGALFDDKGYLATAQALEDCQLIFIEKDGFKRVLRSDFRLVDNLLSLLRRRQEIMAQKVEELALLDAVSRVSRHLLRLRDRESNLVSFPVNKKQTALSLGMAVETFSRVMHKLKKNGVVEDFSPGVLRIKDPEKLADWAG